MIPKGFSEIGPADHPRDGGSGVLIRNRLTGGYVLLSAGAVRSVPHQWAQDTAAGMGKGGDAIQDRCISRMAQLDLNPNKVADMLDGRVSRSHVFDYLSRRASIGSHKLQHVLAALKLTVQDQA